MRPLASPLLFALLLAAAASPASAEPVHATIEIEADCDAEPGEVLAALGLERIYLDLDGPEPPCLGPRLAAALLAALRHPDLVELADHRAEPCDVRCWLDRPTAAIARVGHRRDQIWPAPPAGLAGLAGGDDVVFFVCSPDLGTVWMWIAVSRPHGARLETSAVSDR